MKKFSISVIICLLLQLVTKAQIRTINPVSISRPATEIIIPEIIIKPTAFRLTTPETFDHAISKESNYMGTALVFGVKDFDWSNTIKGNAFVVPEDGVYHFDIQIDFTYPLTDVYNYERFYLMLCSAPGTVLEKIDFKIIKTEFTPFYSMSMNTTRALTKGFIIYPSFKPIGSNATAPVNITRASFSGFIISKG